MTPNRFPPMQPRTFDEAHTLRLTIARQRREHEGSRSVPISGALYTHLIPEAIERLLREDAWDRPPAEIATALWLTDGVDHVDAARARVRTMDHPCRWVRALAAERTYSCPDTKLDRVLGARGSLRLIHRAERPVGLDMWVALTSRHEEVRVRALHCSPLSSWPLLLPAIVGDVVLERAISRVGVMPAESLEVLTDCVERTKLPARDRLRLAHQAIRRWHHPYLDNKEAEGRRHQSLLEARDGEALLAREAERWGVRLEEVRPGRRPASAAEARSVVALQLRLLWVAASYGEAAVDSLLPSVPPERTFTPFGPHAHNARIHAGAWSASFVLALLFFVHGGGALSPRSFARLAYRVPSAWCLASVDPALRLRALTTLIRDTDLPALDRRALPALLRDPALAAAARAGAPDASDAQVDDRWHLVERALRALPVSQRVPAVAEQLPEAMVVELIRLRPSWRQFLAAHTCADAERQRFVTRCVMESLLTDDAPVSLLLTVGRTLPMESFRVMWDDRLREAYLADLASAEQAAADAPLSRAKHRWVVADLETRLQEDDGALQGVLRALGKVNPGAVGPATDALIALAASHPSRLVDALGGLSATELGAWADRLLFCGMFPQSFEHAVAPLFSAVDEPRAQRYARAVRDPAEVFPTPQVRAEMRAHWEFAWAGRARRAGLLNPGPVTAQVDAPDAQRHGLAVPVEGVVRAHRRLDATQRNRLSQRVDALKKQRKGASPARPYAGRFPWSAPSSGPASERESRADRRRRLRERVRPRALLPTQLDSVLRARYRRATSEVLDTAAARVLAAAESDPERASRDAVELLCDRTDWGRWLEPDRSANGVHDTSERRRSLDTLIRLAAPALTFESVPAALNALLPTVCLEEEKAPSRTAGLAALSGLPAGDATSVPQPMLRFVLSMPWSLLVAVFRWARFVPSEFRFPDAVRTVLVDRLQAVPDAALAPHTDLLRAWVGELRDPVLRQALARRLTSVGDRDRVREELARLWIWTQEHARRLVGRPVGLEFLIDPRMGYADTEKDIIAVNVLPLLRNDPRGRALVEALVLHELGHLAWHADRSHTKAWNDAHRDGVGGMLNIVLDEQLERKLRALDARWGEQLHQLTAWVFGPGQRSMDIESVWRALGAGALRPAVRAWLRRPERWGPTHHLVWISTDQIRELSRRDKTEEPRDSQNAFLWNLRTGRGTRGLGARGRAALTHFDRSVVRDDADESLDRARRVARIWQSEADPWSHLTGVPRQRAAVAADAGTIDPRAEAWGEGATVLGGVDAEEVEALVRSAGSGDLVSGGAGGLRWHNVSEDLRVPPLKLIESPPRRPEAEAALLAECHPRGHALAAALARLGRRRLPRGNQSDGVRLDPVDLVGRLLRGDPRMLQRVRIEPAPRFFLGMCIDTSGSMRLAGRIQRAAQMGAILWTAASSLDGSQCEVLAFNHQVMWDCVQGSRTSFASLTSSGENNDAAALRAMCERAVAASHVTHRIVVMISDGSPTTCSERALAAEVERWTRRGVTVAQFCLRSNGSESFPHKIVVDDGNEVAALRTFQRFIEQLAEGRAAA